jgi:hypothetical protein
MRATLDRTANGRHHTWFATGRYQRVTDLAGPDVITVPEAIRMVCERDSRRVPSLINLPAVGGWLSGFAARTNLPGPDVRIGGKSFIEWLRG